MKIRREILGHARKNINIPKHITSELSYLYGAYLGDGSVIGRGQFKLAVSDYDFALNVKNCIENVFKNEATIRKIKNLWHTDFHSIHMKKIFIEKTKKKKIIPKEIINGSSKIKSSFLKGFFDSEGSVSSNRITRRIVISQKHPNEILVLVRKLCESLGIKCGKLGLTKRFYDSNNIVCQACKHRNCPCVSERFGIHGFPDIKRFSEIIGFSIKRQQKKIDELLSSYSQKSYASKTYKKVLKLSQQSSIPTISKELNIPYNTVWQWIKQKRIPPDVKKEINRGYQCEMLLF